MLGASMAAAQCPSGKKPPSTASSKPIEKGRQVTNLTTQASFKFDASEIPRGTPVYNVSRLLNFNRCEMYFNYSDVHRLELDGIAVPLEVGTVVHWAIEEMHKSWPCDERQAEFITRQASQRLRAAFIPPGTTLDADAAEKLREATTWLEAILPLYAEYYHDWTTWDRVLCVEKPMELLVTRKLDDKHSDKVLFVGTPDAIVESMGRVRHLQRKTMSPRSSFKRFLESQRISLHEAIYGEMIAAGLRDGILDSNLPYGGSIIDVLVKKAYPHMPVNTTKDGRITEAYQKKLDKFAADKLIYAGQALQRQTIPFSDEQRHSMIDNAMKSAVVAHLVEEGIGVPVANFGSACSAYMKTCEFAELCALTRKPNSSVYANRGDDYVLARRRELEAAWSA